MGSIHPPFQKPLSGASVSADLEALKNDVEQAKALACEYQRQLEGKASEVVRLKQLFEKTTADLIHLHQGITGLREERHHLANEAMRVQALEIRLDRVTEERDRLEFEVGQLRAARAGDVEGRVQLIAEVERLQRELRGQRSAPREVTASRSSAGPAEYIPMSYTDTPADEKVTLVPSAPTPGGAGRRRRSH